VDHPGEGKRKFTLKKEGKRCQGEKLLYVHHQKTVTELGEKHRGSGDSQEQTCKYTLALKEKFRTTEKR